ncbi:4-hydroxy-3-methylbut-2-enyl diphosphate reductase [Clostridia bacterium]|nr:4-hydroxy-3-methylbut-2-enyl diphosphate reductase [Clostridia bacterium]
MELVVAERVGFCPGVESCLKSVETLLSKGNKLCVLGEIVHNKEVLNDLKSRGVRFTESLDDALEDEILVLRAHGSTKETYIHINNLNYVKLNNVSDEIKMGVKYFFDGVCPFVKKIHDIVKEMPKDATLIVLGDKNHCETKGIVSYASGEVFVCKDSDELRELLQNNEELCSKQIYMVSQTTFLEKEEKKCEAYAKELGADVVFFDTICYETKMRQKEAEKIAEQSDLVLVLGSKTSSNTMKLFKICQAMKKTVLIENAASLNEIDFSNCERVGIVAGASVPRRLFEEVKKHMDSIDQTEFNFEEELNKSFRKLRIGDQIKGIVTRVDPSEVQLDMDAKYAGYISINEFEESNIKLQEHFSVGDEIEAIVIKINDAEGSAELSRKRVVNQGGFDETREAMESGTILSGQVVKVLDAGIIASYKGVKVFIHNSQLEPPNATGNSLFGKEVSFKVSIIDDRRRSAKGSMKAAKFAQRELRAQELWKELEVGQTRKGIVKSLIDFGVFVDLGGLDGLIYISDLSWGKVQDVNSFFKIGEEIKVRVKSLDQERNRVALTYRQEADNPWVIFNSRFKEGDEVETKVVAVKNFGIFVGIIPGIDGFVHISELSKNFTSSPFQVFKVRDSIKAKILEIDNERQKVKMSIKALQEEEAPIDVAQLANEFVTIDSHENPEVPGVPEVVETTDDGNKEQEAAEVTETAETTE